MLSRLQDKVYRDCLLYPDLTQGGAILISFLSLLKNTNLMSCTQGMTSTRMPCTAHDAALSSEQRHTCNMSACVQHTAMMYW